MQLRSYFLTFLLIYSCNAYTHNERFISNENMTVLDILLKMASVEDLIIPSINNREKGDVQIRKRVG